MTSRAVERSRRSELPITSFEWPHGPGVDWALKQEWLVTNGLGGYASGTICGCNTRRYHALLVASFPGKGRVVMLPYLREEVILGDQRFSLTLEERADAPIDPAPVRALRAFRLNGLVPEWDFEFGPVWLRRRLMLVHGESTVVIAYQQLKGPPASLRLRPFPHFRPFDQQLRDVVGVPGVWLKGDRAEVRATDDALPLRLRLHYTHCLTPFVGIAEASPLLVYRLEQLRGYEHTERLMSAGYFECTMSQGQELALVATTEGWGAADRAPNAAFAMEQVREDRLLDHAALPRRSDAVARLVLAADQFLVEPVSRPQDVAWARATGEVARTVIAGYHWFADWGRDTMISLEGLTLNTGRYDEASDILRTFQRHVRNGLLPNLFPEGERQGQYNTADASLWFFHAIDRYLAHTGDEELLWDLLPTLESIVEHHLHGTDFNIGVDPTDGLLRQGVPDRPLTWMDAWVDGWVVTPRRGKAVELNGLWYNALCLLAEWSDRFGLPSGAHRQQAERARESFNRRFWNEATQCLYDVVDGDDGDDPSIRPNQIFSFSLKYPVLEERRWWQVLDVIRKVLLTPRGLRTLDPQHPDYQHRYYGDQRHRDAAYHQGTVWPWLLGHYVDAALRAHEAPPVLLEALHGALECLNEHCIGQISEIFDADPPYESRGCIAQAWSVAESLRAIARLRALRGEAPNRQSKRTPR